MFDAPWQITQNVVHLRLPGLEAAVNVAAPGDGLGQLRLGEQSQAGAIFQLVLPSEELRATAVEAEAYVRGNDLIVIYNASQQWPFRVHVCWRALRASDSLAALGGVELIASVQTQLLDSRPELSVATCLPAGELFSLTDAEAGVFETVAIEDRQPITLAPQRGADCVLYRFATTAGSNAPAFSYAEMIHTSDLGPAKLRPEPAGGVRLSRQLFASFLEKGVILRTRLRGVFLERADDAAAAVAWRRALLQSKLPLTA